MTTSYMVYFVTMYFRPLDGYVSRNHNMEVRVGDVDAAMDLTANPKSHVITATSPHPEVFAAVWTI